MKTNTCKFDIVLIREVPRMAECAHSFTIGIHDVKQLNKLSMPDHILPEPLAHLLQEIRKREQQLLKGFLGTERLSFTFGLYLGPQASPLTHHHICPVRRETDAVLQSQWLVT